MNNLKCLATYLFKHFKPIGSPQSMKILISVATVLVVISAQAQKVNISGSDTLGGVMTDAIIAAGLNQKIAYIGGGSGVGEKALANGEIAVTGMSREFKPEIIALAKSKGIEPVAHVIALDGLAILVNQSNPMASIDFSTLTKIFSCEFTSWNQVPGSGKNGPIKVYRRDDKSGTTDTFKSLVGIKTFGACVTILAETADIADRTSSESESIAYAGLSGKRDGNRAVAVASKAGSVAVEPNTTTIRNASYPLARKLFFYEATGAKSVEGAEAELLEYVLDRSFLDPIVQDHDFITLD